MASLDTCEPSIDAARRNGTSAKTATAAHSSQDGRHQRDGHAGHERRATHDHAGHERRERRQPLDRRRPDPDADACLRVLDRITKTPPPSGRRQHRRLRGAVRAAHGAPTAGDFGGDGPVRKSTATGSRRGRAGSSSGEELARHAIEQASRRWREGVVKFDLRAAWTASSTGEGGSSGRSVEARATRRRDLDQKHRDSTLLRKQRIDKLKALENDQGPLAGARRAPAKEGERLLEAAHTNSFRHCYTCKKRFDGLHEFYSQLCPACAALNWRMRSRTEDLSGRVALLTGARVKIGFETGLKLLRAGAYLIATTRFLTTLARVIRHALRRSFLSSSRPNARVRAGREADADEWRGRLRCTVDPRIRGRARLRAFIAERHEALDVRVNNACQTVRRRYFRGVLVTLR